MDKIADYSQNVRKTQDPRLFITVKIEIICVDVPQT
jgi:hypothetical protein